MPKTWAPTTSTVCGDVQNNVESVSWAINQTASHNQTNTICRANNTCTKQLSQTVAAWPPRIATMQTAVQLSTGPNALLPCGCLPEPVNSLQTDDAEKKKKNFTCFRAKVSQQKRYAAGMCMKPLSSYINQKTLYLSNCLLHLLASLVWGRVGSAQISTLAFGQHLFGWLGGTGL